MRRGLRYATYFSFSSSIALSNFSIASSKRPWSKSSSPLHHPSVELETMRKEQYALVVAWLAPIRELA